MQKLQKSTMNQLSKGEEKMNDQVLYIIDFDVTEGKETDMQQLIEDLMESTSKESGVLNYHWAKNGNIYDSLEHFESSKAAYDHLTNFAENFAERYMSLGTVISTTVYGNPNPAVKEILNGFEAVYKQTIANYSK